MRRRVVTLANRDPERPIQGSGIRALYEWPTIRPEIAKRYAVRKDLDTFVWEIAPPLPTDELPPRAHRPESQTQSYETGVHRVRVGGPAYLNWRRKLLLATVCGLQLGVACSMWSMTSTLTGAFSDPI
jgi:hypothetical protein